MSRPCHSCKTLLGVWETPPYIKATPTTIAVPVGKTQGPTALSWDAGKNYPDAALYLTIDGAAETLFSQQATGSRTWNVTANQTHTFKLYAGKNKLLATLAVNALNPIVPTSPPGATSPILKAIEKDSIYEKSKIVDLLMISNVQIIHLNQRVGVAIGFNSLRNVVPILELGKVAPIRKPDGSWAFPDGQAIGAWPCGGPNNWANTFSPSLTLMWSLSRRPLTTKSSMSFRATKSIIRTPTALPP